MEFNGAMGISRKNIKCCMYTLHDLVKVPTMRDLLEEQCENGLISSLYLWKFVSEDI